MEYIIISVGGYRYYIPVSNPTAITLFPNFTELHSNVWDFAHFLRLAQYEPDLIRKGDIFCSFQCSFSQSNCKIMIRGKGSVKEGKIGRKDGMPLPGEDEPLHALVTGTKLEDVQKATAEINRIIKQVGQSFFPVEQQIL